MNKSIGPNLKYIQKIEEQEQLIEFLKSKYKEKTGFEAPSMENQSLQPSHLQQSKTLNNRSIILPPAKSIIFGQQQEEQKTQEQHQTFYDAVSRLRLPTKIIPQKNKPVRGNLKTTLDLKNPFHTIEVIDLGGYQTRNFNRLALKDFLEQLQDMRTLHTLILKNNGIDDSYHEELKYIITNTHVRNLDLSHNEIGPKGIEGFLTALKEVSYIRSLNLSRNNFSGVPQTLSAYCQALQQQAELYHVCLDAHKVGSNDYKGADVICKFVSTQKSLRSVVIQDTRISDITKISATLGSATSHLTELTLKYCFLTSEHVKVLAQSLGSNNSLVYLNLQHNGLSDLSGQFLAQMIYSNHCLYALDLEHNQLGNDFVFRLVEALRRNNVLAILRLGYNCISEIKPLLQVIGPENQSITDLGDLQNNPITLAQVDQLQKRIAKPGGVQQVSYTILKPIKFAQTLHRTQNKIRVWNV